MTAHPYADGCPNCVLTRNDPLHTEPVNDGHGVLCHYRCSLCDHRWTCSWLAEPAATPDSAGTAPADDYRTT
jgi:hypothetical protein